MALSLIIAVPSRATADGIRDRQWHLKALRIAQAQEITRGAGVVVAVIDTGVDDRHGELSGAVLPGKEFGEQPADDGKRDTDGHGTAMAGLIAGRGLSGSAGVLGVAPEATILPVQTLHSEFGGSPIDLGSGIAWAAGQGAKVICVAAGTSEYPEVKTAVEAAVKADVVVVAAAGNLPQARQVAFPAKLPGVLAVGGTDKDGNHTPASATGPEVALAAPAVDIVSTGAFGKYVTGDGTSNATAIVAGVVALVRAKYPDLSAVEVVRRLTATATDRGKPGRDDEYGYGIVNPVAALTASIGPPAAAASSSTADRAGPGGGSGQSPVVWVLLGGGAAVAAAGLLLRRRRRPSG
ncbi:S8 family serine peptidase [Dactylosporangium aurantiacum]|uniref:S8 family serine peptidase n=1 Tax=Dactylosporangium aurantiacum TaxID=35754 RepID=A0A9Q9MIW0_9ACTN|nr:S8 family serine peptidase [Dactylosporangium aurantiacum]MDG6109759.1 S8 family serine peptidase [Dactylosporangium aurantiacum]UWZ56305.1 S8 family serine peptidase [Dactylosporangium aurantiacum]